MRTLPLGRSGVDVTELAYGGGGIGGIGASPRTLSMGLDRAAAERMLDEAAGRGIRLVDTADGYGGGASETVIGRWRDDRDAPDVLVATKVGNLADTGRPGVDLSPAHITARLQRSRRRLGRVDLVVTQGADPSTPWSETLAAFAQAIDAGRVRAFGLSDVGVRDVEAALLTADAAGLPRPEWVQNRYNLAERGDERDLFPLLEAEGLGYLPHSPLGGGALTERYLDGREPQPGDRLHLLRTFYAGEGSERSLAAVAAMVPFARERDVSVAALSLAWLRAQPRVTSIVLAPRGPAQWEAVDEALTVDLDDAEVERIAGLFG